MLKYSTTFNPYSYSVRYSFLSITKKNEESELMNHIRLNYDIVINRHMQITKSQRIEAINAKILHTESPQKTHCLFRAVASDLSTQ